MKLNPNLVEVAKKICEASKQIGESEYDLVLCETFELVDSDVSCTCFFATLHQHCHLCPNVLIGLVCCSLENSRYNRNIKFCLSYKWIFIFSKQL